MNVTLTLASILESTDSDQECQVRCSDDNSLETAKDQMTETDLAGLSLGSGL